MKQLFWRWGRRGSGTMAERALTPIERLCGATVAGDLEGVHEILSAWPEAIGAAHPSGGTALHFAAANAQVAVAAYLLRAGAAVDAVEAGSEATPLVYAVMARDREMTRLLLDAGAPVSLPRGLGLRATDLERWCAAVPAAGRRVPVPAL